MDHSSPSSAEINNKCSYTPAVHISCVRRDNLHFKVLVRSVMTLPGPSGNFQHTPTFWNCSICKTGFSAWLKIVEGIHHSVICTWLSKFCTCMISSHKYAGSKRKPHSHENENIHWTRHNHKLNKIRKICCTERGLAKALSILCITCTN